MNRYREDTPYRFRPPRRTADLVDRIYRFGEAALGMREMELLGRTLGGPLPDRVREFREVLLHDAEDRFGTDIRTGTHPDRIRRLRGLIRSTILTRPPAPPERLRECYEILDRLHLAFQLYSYPAQYVRERPTQERMAETILKFEEDLFGEYTIRGPRRAEVTFCEPIDAGTVLDECHSDLKAAVCLLTQRLADAIRNALGAPVRTEP
ncbi:MAG: hypothetical protein JXR77_18630 [Lentisphaeria bacterium]|nr:hypothetical protein [Lentisphaeria bacterium]